MLFLLGFSVWLSVFTKEGKMSERYKKYLKFYEQAVVKFPGLPKKTKDEVDFENFQEKVGSYFSKEFYSSELDDIYYEGVDWEAFESEEYHPLVKRGDELSDSVYEIMLCCYNQRGSIPNTAGLVYEFLRSENALKNK